MIAVSSCCVLMLSCSSRTVEFISSNLRFVGSFIFWQSRKICVQYIMHIETNKKSAGGRHLMFCRHSIKIFPSMVMHAVTWAVGLTIAFYQKLQQSENISNINCPISRSFSNQHTLDLVHRCINSTKSNGRIRHKQFEICFPNSPAVEIQIVSCGPTGGLIGLVGHLLKAFLLPHLFSRLATWILKR